VGVLVLRVAGGDRAAFGALVTDTRTPLFRYLRGLVRSDEVAEDALQETFVAVWRGAGAWRGESSGRVWLFGIARRLAARSWRRRSGEPDEAVPLEALGAEAGFGSDDPEVSLASVRDVRRVHAALDTLSDVDREVVTLRDLDGFSGPEVAELLELPLANVKTRLHRARLRLLAALRANGGADVH
jgi:RNA polymerase sigma-70 factor (ECF subfamily)